MSQVFSEMARATRSLQTVKNARQLLPKFHNRGRSRGNNNKVPWAMVGVPPELLNALELECEFPENFGTLCSANLVAPRFIEIAEAEGYSNDLCSYLTNSMGYARRYLDLGGPPPESPLPGGIGAPSMLLGSGYTCDPRYKWFQAMATRYFKVPVFNSDPLSPPFDADLDDPEIRVHYLAQLRADLHAQVGFLELNSGKKLDLERLRSCLSNSQKALLLWHATLELQKSRPCPMGASDYFSAIIPQLFLLGEQEAVDYYQAVYDEVKDRVDRGVGVLKEEKHRLLWGGLPPWFNLGLFNYLERLGAVVVVDTTYYPGPPVDLDIDDPLEYLVQRTWEKTRFKHGTRMDICPEYCNPAVAGGVGSDLIRRWVDEYHLDGAMMHRTRTCRAVSMRQIIACDVLSKAGIKSLIIESDMADPRTWSDERVKFQVETYLESIAR